MSDKPPSFEPIQITEHLLKSDIVPQTFRIRIFQPIRRSDGSERFPVVYATDADGFFNGHANLADCLQGMGEVPRFILVGIGYEDSAAWGMLRSRDLWSWDVRKLYSRLTDAYATMAEGIDDFDKVMNSTDAADFLRFIREELMPFVDANYPTLPDDRSYYGYSAGGAFGFYTLFTQSETFRRYVIASPGASFDGHNFVIRQAEAFKASRKSLDAKVYMSVGDAEDFSPGYSKFELVSGYVAVATYLKKTPIPGLDLTTRMFLDETHSTAWAPGFTHGLKAVFGPAETTPFRPEPTD